MSVLLLALVAYLHILKGNLEKVPALWENPTSYNRLENDSNSREFENAENRSIFETRKPADDMQTDIGKDSEVYQENPQVLAENGKIEEGFSSGAAQNFRLFDPEWNPTFLNNNSIPNIIMDLYESVGSDSSDSFVPKIDLIRCFRVEKYGYAASGVTIKFNFNDKRSKEQIVASELYIYRFPQIFKRSSPDSSIIRLYHILSTKETDENADIHELLGIIYVSPYDEGWQKFNVEKSVEKWRNGEPNLGFLLSVTDTWGNIIEPKYFDLDMTQSLNSPLLVVHLQQVCGAADSQKSERFMESHLMHRGDVIQQDLENFSKEAELIISCKRRPFFINFEKDDLRNFILHPKGVPLYKCMGTCRLSTTDSFTNHAKMLSLLKTSSEGQIIESCCVPKKYLPATLMFYDSFGNIVIKKYYDMIVDSCGCR